MNEQFKITSKTVYTIDSKHGRIDCIGIEGLQEHCDNVLGAFIDNMYSSYNYSGMISKDKLMTHEFIMKNKDELQTILVLQDSINQIKSDLEEL